ncbi:Zinc transporter ZIP4 [Merluccius polli]|uniref:Zinc transporter ZIP4 n=1 Tax=Merluccius polli TaxID=89951 RepID=A0AA47P0G8_MERPO|nr:Zinc transporter ZIP4 [Merluccius polli]
MWPSSCFVRTVAVVWLASAAAAAARCSQPEEDATAAAYAAVVAALSPDRAHLTEESVRRLFNTLESRVQCGAVSCGKCNLPGSIHQLIGKHSSNSSTSPSTGGGGAVAVTVSQFPHFASGCMFYLSAPELACDAVRAGRWAEETDLFLDRVLHHQHPHAEEERRSELHSHEREDHPAAAGAAGHEGVHVDVHGLEALIGMLEEHVVPLDNEECLTADDIMAEINACSVGPHQEVERGAVFGRVLNHALIGHCFTTQSLPGEGYFLEYIMEQMGSDNFTIRELKALMKTLKIGPSEHHDHDHDHDHAHAHAGEGHHDDAHSRKRRSHGTRDRQEMKLRHAQRCFSAEELLRIHGMMDNSSDPAAMNRSDLARLSPALVQQVLSMACADVSFPAKPDELSQAERYIYATLANVVITLTSMFGIVVLLCTSCSSVFQLIIQLCISLAVGTLTGDALLHLLPMFLGLHSHGAGGHTHHHDEDNMDYIYKMLVVLAGIYYFYLMETIFSLVTHKEDLHHHHPHHHGEEAEPHHCDHGRVLEMYQKEKMQQSISQSNLVSNEITEKTFPPPQKRTREQRLLPYMITIGDGIHNFADGLAMGAAFALSWRSGLATSLAVLCHELPHELGDFAILLHCGMSVRNALLLNIGSAMTSFVGLYIGLSVATDVATNQWIAAVTAGLFLYVGLADMLPTMIHIKSKRPWLTFLLQNIGLLGGWSILLLLSLYEDQIGV